MPAGFAFVSAAHNAYNSPAPNSKVFIALGLKNKSLPDAWFHERKRLESGAAVQSWQNSGQ
jgi:hypothetical protein